MESRQALGSFTSLSVIASLSVCSSVLEEGVCHSEGVVWTVTGVAPILQKRKLRPLMKVTC